MSSGELLRVAWSSLNQRRMRSLLTVLCITIGAFSVVVMSSLADSGLSTLEHGIEELGGARMILVLQRQPTRGEAKQSAYSRGLTLADRDRILVGLPHVTGASLYTRVGKREVTASSGARAMTDIVATDAAFFDAFKMPVARGAPFSEEDNKRRAQVCVVGSALVSKLGALAVGDSLSLGVMRCLVVGIFAQSDHFGVGFGFDWKNLVVVPQETYGDLDAAVSARASVLVQTDDVRSNNAVMRLLNARLIARHPGVDDFSLLDFSGVMARFGAIFTAMKLIIAVLAGISLLVGGVGVLNIMLVAVSERAREIGVRRALGARRSSIAAQFLSEACLLASGGGAMGVLLGLGVAFAMSRLIVHFLPAWQPSLAPSAALFAEGSTLIIGAVFGVLPARRASNLDPASAMRL